MFRTSLPAEHDGYYDRRLKRKLQDPEFKAEYEQAEIEVQVQVSKPWDWPPRWHGTVSMVRLPAYASKGCTDEAVNLVHASWGLSKPRWRGWTTAEILTSIKATL